MTLNFGPRLCLSAEITGMPLLLDLCSSGPWTQGLLHARQALWQLTYISSSWRHGQVSEIQLRHVSVVCAEAEALPSILLYTTRPSTAKCPRQNHGQQMFLSLHPFLTTKIKDSFSCFKLSFTSVIFFLEMFTTGFFFYLLCVCVRENTEMGEGSTRSQAHGACGGLRMSTLGTRWVLEIKLKLSVLAAGAFTSPSRQFLSGNLVELGS